jgi:hypothetical protein
MTEGILYYESRRAAAEKEFDVTAIVYPVPSAKGLVFIAEPE